MSKIQLASHASRTVALVAAAALAIGAVASPASAAHRDDPAGEAKASPEKQSNSPQRAKRYCVVGTVTGSIRQKTCKTREQWIKEDGFDPLARK